jgi:hypothetical protein
MSTTTPHRSHTCASFGWSKVALPPSLSQHDIVMLRRQRSLGIRARLLRLMGLARTPPPAVATKH